MPAGKSAAEVARSLETDPGDLYRRRRELEEHGSSAFTSGGGSGPGRTGRPNWSGRSANRRWRSIS